MRPSDDVMLAAAMAVVATSLMTLMLRLRAVAMSVLEAEETTAAADLYRLVVRSQSRLSMISQLPA